MAKRKVVHANVFGIKCDNSKCNYTDPTVTYEDYPNWLNKPCPLCGCNLLTQADYDICKKMMDLAEIANSTYEVPENNDDLKNVTYHFGFNGTGTLLLKGVSRE